MTKDIHWDSPDWLESVQCWTNQQLAELGISPIGSLEPVSGWALGQILKQQTDNGFYFFKATAFLPLFSNESRLCLQLSELMPNYVPETVRVCEGRQWMLSKDFGGGLPEQTDKSIWADAFASFTNFQVDSIPHLKALKASGCLERPISNIPEQLTDILSDRNVTQHLPAEVCINQAQLLAKVTSSIKALERFNLPETLVHGDLHIENIALKDGHFLFFDWSDGCVSHPFVDGTYIYRMPPSEKKQKIIEAYLAKWQHIASLDVLIEAWQTAEIVCYAHQAVTYGSMKQSLKDEQMQDLEQAFVNAFGRLSACL